MKKIAFMCVYNDADYVDYAIRSVKDWVDELIIVEGAFGITQELGLPARSTDGTLDIIASHVDNKRIFTIPANLREHKDHYDIGYQWALGRGADWTLLIDSDEVWTPEAQRVLDQALTPEAPEEIQIEEHCFINDFRTCYRGVYPRVFKAIPGSRFVYDNEVHFGGFTRGGHRMALLKNATIFHYGYVRRKERFDMKQAYMYNKDHNPAIQRDYGLEGDSYRIPSDIPVSLFTGEHPELMRTHPYFNKTAHDIMYA